MMRWLKRLWLRASYRQQGRSRRDFYDWATLFTAIIGVVVVAGTLVVSAEQASLSRKQLSQIYEQKRPWLRLSARPVTGVEVGADGDVKSIIEVSATNVGALPAKAARLQTRIYPAPTHLNSDRRSPYGEPIVCGPRQEASIHGATIFPGESHTFPIEIPKLDPEHVRKLLDGDGKFQLLVTTCVDYEGVGIQSYGRTGVLYYIVKTADGQPGNSEFSLQDMFLVENVELRRLEIAEVLE